MEGILTMRASRPLRRVRGSSFVEILVAMAILAVMMVGILQMYSAALITNYGAAARTELLYKAQQVVENLRLVYFLQGPGGNDTARAASGVPASLGATATPIYLPYVNGDGDTTLTWAYWGPAGVNIVEDAGLPFRLRYTVEDRGAFWLVTVTATPVDNPRLAGTLPVPGTGDRKYLGVGSKLKIVTYAAQIEK
jgi:Tfp pilus assembly protein PilE